MDSGINKQSVLHQKLTENLQVFSSVFSINWKETDEKFVLEKLLEIKQLLQNANVGIMELEKRLEQCDCLGKKIFCMMSVIALEASQYLNALSVAIEETDGAFSLGSEFVFSLTQKGYICQMLEFIVFNGLIAHLEFQISLLFQKSHASCYQSRQDFFNICRNLISCAENSTLRNILASKHLLVLLASLIQLSYSPTFSKFLTYDDVKFSKKCLTKIMVGWCQLKDVVKCLFVIQGSSSRTNPKWLSKTCGALLSKCLLRKHGVSAVISSLLATLASEMGSWKKVEVASKILSTPAHLCSDEQYYLNICEQIFLLFQNRNIKDFDDDSEQLSTQILTATVFSLFKRSFDLTSRYFFNKILFPLNNFCVKITRENDDKNNSESCASTGMCIEILCKLFVSFKHPFQEEAVKSILLPYFNVLFALYVWSRDRVSHIRTLIKQLLVKCSQAYSSSNAAGLLLSLCGIVDKNVDHLLLNIHKLKTDVVFTSDEDDEIIIQKGVCFTSAEKVIDDQNKKVAAVMEIASASKTEKLLSQIFLLLCEHIGRLSQEVDYEKDTNELLTPEENAGLHLQRGESQLLAYALLATLCEECEPKDLLEDLEQITSFVKVLLTRLCSMDSDPAHLAINRESLKLCYAVLGLCLLDIEVETRSKSVKSLVPLLQKLSTLQYLSSEDKEMASDLAIAIATRCACSGFSMEDFSQTLQSEMKNLEAKYSACQDSPSSKTNQGKQQDILDQATPLETVKESKIITSLTTNIKLLSQPTENATVASLKQRVDESSIKSSNSLNEAIQSLFDSCPSVSGLVDLQNRFSSLFRAILRRRICHLSLQFESYHRRAAGMRFIATAMKNGVEEAVEKAGKISEILLEVLLKEDDSFVYLSTIQAVVETVYRAPMVSSSTRALFDHLVDEYDKYIQSPDGDLELKISKLGEVLVRIVGKLGDLADYQSSKLLPILLRGSRHLQAPVRCSCISNLAELCPMLRHRLATCRFELSECVCATVLHDGDVTVRRAAVHLMRKLVDSFQSDLLQIFSESMKKFYSVMKRAYQDDADHVVQLHAQLALEALDDVMRDAMFHQPVRKSKAMEKKITILS